MSSVKYRPDIDGLRAIAILVVVGFHAFPKSLSGGFVGVDVFFVISGFLISSIIFRELEDGRFSLKEFYVRRIRRIFPALICLMIVGGFLGWYVLLPDEFMQLGKHIAAGNGFISNIILWQEAGYFDNSSETKPLLHLWSLGIEEQFYFIWPISLALVWRSRRGVLTLTLSIALLSFVTSLYALKTYSSATAFYLPMYRFWELMVGGFLAYVVAYKKWPYPTNKLLVNILSLLGLGFMVSALCLLDKKAQFPGWWALLPTLGSFMLILAKDAWLNRRVLSSRPLVYIGLISYPLYLWHWLLLSFGHIVDLVTWEQKAWTIVLSLVLSVLTYELLEKSVKKAKGGRVVGVLITLSLILFLLGLGAYYGKLSPRNNSAGIKLAMEAVGDWEHPSGMKKKMLNGLKTYTKISGDETVLFYGDSHMEQYSPRIAKLLDENPANTKSVVFITSGGCPPVLNVFKKEERTYSNCRQDGKEKIIEYALSPEVDSVVIAAMWGTYFSVGKRARLSPYYYLAGTEKVPFEEGGADLAVQEFEEFLVSLSRIKKVYLVIDNPAGNAFNPKNHFTGTRLSGYVDNELLTQRLNHRQIEMREKMIDIAMRTGAIMIDPLPILCDEDFNCRTKMEDGRPIYKDGNHIRPFFVREFMDVFDVTVQK